MLITADKTGIPAVVLKHPKGMKEAWCVATTRVDLGAAGVVKLYARRFTIEETFRDINDNHFGWTCPQPTSTRRSVATAFSCWPPWHRRC